MTDSPWFAAAIAVFAWWFATGAILWRVRVADNGGHRAHLVSVVAGLPLLAGGIWLAARGAGDASVTGTYLGFFAALALWAFIELAFLSGVITGPNRAPCPPDARLFDRFVRACGTILWHEAALLVTLCALALVPGGHPVAVLTFALLFGARVLAQLNFFFGVPRINTQFIPRPLRHLPSHFRLSRASLFLPLSVGVLAVLTVGLLLLARNAATVDAGVGWALLSTLAALALVEHLFMVLPLPDDRLWRWMLPAAKTHSPASLHEDANGL